MCVYVCVYVRGGVKLCVDVLGVYGGEHIYGACMPLPFVIVYHYW